MTSLWLLCVSIDFEAVLAQHATTVSAENVDSVSMDKQTNEVLFKIPWEWVAYFAKRIYKERIELALE